MKKNGISKCSGGWFVVLLLSTVSLAMAQAVVTDAVPIGELTQPQPKVAVVTTPSKLSSLQQQLQLLQRQLAQLQQQWQSLQQQLKPMLACARSHQSQIKSQSRVSDNQSTVDKTTATRHHSAIRSKATKSEAKTRRPLAKTAVKGSESDAGQAYHAALSLAKNKKYSSSINALNKFIKTYPQDSRVGDAYYWLGQLSLLSNQDMDAKKAFLQTVKHYPKSSKSSDAALSLGFMAVKQKQPQQAKQWFRWVLKRSPNSAVAQLATESLNALK